MEMERAVKRLMQSAEKPVSMPSEEQLRVITKWVGMFMELNHKEISELGMAAYIEGLRDLSVTEIERGCQRALKEVDHMPTVAHIRQRINIYDENVFSSGERGCDLCRHTGWLLTRREDGKGNIAKRCECGR